MDDYTNGITLGLDPVVFQVGRLSLRWFGVAVALGLAVGLYLTIREARRKGIAEDAVWAVAVWAIVLGILGARAFHVVDKLDFYLQNPTLLISLSQGGTAVWGGILGGLLGLWIGARRRGISAGRLADAATPGLLVGLMIGRLGSLLNGESWGAATPLPWGVIYASPNAMLPAENVGVPTHPYPAYEILWLLVVFAVLWRLRDRLRVDGALFSAFLILYSVGRFALTYVREEGYFLFRLQQAQDIAAAVFLVALPYLVYLLTVRREVDTSGPSPAGGKPS